MLAFLRGNILVVFNFHHGASYTDYGVLVPPATKWRHLFDTDEVRFGGQGRVERGRVYEPRLVYDDTRGEIVQQIGLYLPARTAIALCRVRCMENGRCLRHGEGQRQDGADKVERRIVE